MTLTITPLPNIPLIHKGDNLPRIILAGLKQANIVLEDGDILVITQKIVSKAEGRLVDLRTISPSQEARALAIRSEKDPRLVELILRESREVLRVRPGTIIVEHRLGFICASAGIDHSNVDGPFGDTVDWVLLLPEDPDHSAGEIREELERASQKKIGVLIIDSHGRAWRLGIMGTCIGISGVPAIVDKRGKSDIFGYQLQITLIAAADELAAAASLVMGQADERIPVVHARGFPYALCNGSTRELFRPKGQDLFR